MRRLGRQHGLVLFFEIMPQFLNSRPKSRIINQFDSPPTTARFTRAPAKPTNHSRYTSRCGNRPQCRWCHDHPASKAQSKTKHAHKRRSHDVGLNHGLFFHNLTGRACMTQFGGAPAAAILDFLYDDDCYWYSDWDHDYDYDDVYDYNYYNHDDDGIIDDTDFNFVEFERDLEDGWCLVGAI